MNIINTEKFKRLRLTNFLDELKITHLNNWEYQGKKWLGEANSFTQFLQPESQPFETHSISLDIQNLNDEELWKISEELSIILDKKILKEDIIEDFGNIFHKKEFNNNNITSFTYKIECYRVKFSFSKEGTLVFFEMFIK